jgi:twitching motility protein PilT
MIDIINSTRPVHILTIEDPIEYLHSHKVAAVSQREVGMDTPSFASALRAALREDPDVIHLGEMRDPETISTALTLAETGHLVFATLHTNDAAQSLDRIVDVFPPERREQVQIMLAGTLQGIISQRLLARISGGRVAAFEVLVATEATRNLVREGKTRQIRNIITTGRAEGMQTIEHSLTELVRAGVITREVAESISQHPREILATGAGAPLAAPITAAGARSR